MQGNKIIRAALVAVFAASLPLSALAQISNPGFETGDTGGWTTQVNGASLPITVASGTSITDAGTINPSISGDFYAYTSQTGPGSSFLTQDFVVQAGANIIFFDIAINNSVADYSVPDPLSFDFVAAPNQQARFDILAPGSAIDTVDPADIVATGFETLPGDPMVQDWQRFEIDVTAELTPFVGQTAILRFVQVDNQGFFNMAIDNLSVGSAPPPGVGPDLSFAVPTLQHGVLVLLALLLGAVGIRQFRPV